MKTQPFALESKASLSDWTLTPIFREKVQIAESTIYLCGLAATHPELGEVTGSAANLGNFPDAHAWYELAERVTLVKATQKAEFPLKDPKTGAALGTASVETVFPRADQKDAQFAKSNGVALFSNWAEACIRASLELVERHLILASWLGYSRPEKIRHVLKSPLQELRRFYTVERYSFGRQKIDSMQASVHVSGVVLWPRDLRHPLVYAFGAGLEQKASIVKAEAEVWQRLGFLWGEDLPETEPEFTPHQLYHQELYLYPPQHNVFGAWLRGEFFKPLSSGLPRVLEMSFADISNESAEEFKVAKAICPDALPLVFGKWREGAFAALDPLRLIHPIT